MDTIAFVGLGAMGRPMARNLIRAGYPVRGFDLEPQALAELQAAGGEAAGTLAECLADAATVVLMVVTAAQAESVLFADGAIEAARPDAVICLMTTCPPAQVRPRAGRVAAPGRCLGDAPVSGGVAGATDGSLTIMAAGRAGDYARVRPLLEAMGRRTLHVGDQPGQGALLKTVNQLLCGVHIAAAAEGLALAEKLGVDPRRMLDILTGTAAGSWMLTDRGPRMLEAEPEVTSAVDIFVKDLGIVLEAGRDSRAALPLAALAHQLFTATSGRGDGALDDSQVIRSYRLLNGTA